MGSRGHIFWLNTYERILKLTFAVPPFWDWVSAFAVLAAGAATGSLHFKEKQYQVGANNVNAHGLMRVSFASSSNDMALNHPFRFNQLPIFGRFANLPLHHILHYSAVSTVRICNALCRPAK